MTKNDIKKSIENADVLSVDERQRIAATGVINKNYVIDVFDAYVFNGVGDLVMKSETLTEAGISSSMDQEEIRNGKGNILRAVINKNKNLEVTLTENTFDFQSLAYKNGTRVVQGSGVGSVGTQYLIATNSGGIKVTLAKEPLNGKVVAYCKGQKVTGAVSGTTVTFANGVEAGNEVTIEPYECAVSSAEKIVIKADEFPEGNRLILHTIEVDASMTAVANIYIVIDKAMPDGAWEINTQSERQATDSSVKFKVFANQRNELSTILREPIS